MPSRSRSRSRTKASGPRSAVRSATPKKRFSSTTTSPITSTTDTPPTPPTPVFLVLQVLTFLFTLTSPLRNLLAVILSPLSLWHTPPPPSSVLSLGPVNNLFPTPIPTHLKPLHSALHAILTEQLSSGRQVGFSLCAYHKGSLVAHFVGGVCRSPSSPKQYNPVMADTLFFVNSVSKGLSAAAFLHLVDTSQCSYDDKVCAHWPNFGTNGKQSVTIEDALSHRAGLQSVGGNPAVCFLRCLYEAHTSRDWRRQWDMFVKETESATPATHPGEFASYHAVSYSWLLGGIVDGVRSNHPPPDTPTKGHIRELIHSALSSPLNIAHSDMCMGVTPPHLEPRLALTEPPNAPTSSYKRCSSALREAAGESPLLRFVLTNVLGPVEAQVVAAFIGLEAWRRHSCLPGNNGVVTGRALGKVFGALANLGEAEGDRFVGEETVRDMHERVKCRKGNKIKFDHPDGRYEWLTCRKSCGWFPWASEDLQGLQGKLGTTVGNEGMGGSFAYADCENRLGIVFCKSVYEPLAVIGGSVSVDSCDVAQCIRDHLGIK